MAFNKNELVIERVREITAWDLTNGELKLRITQPKEVSLNTSAETEEVVDAVGNVITILNKAKKGQLTGSNALFSLDLAALQWGTTKQVASDTGKIKSYMSEVLTVDSAKKITLSQTPTSTVDKIYVVVNNDVSKTYNAGAVVSATDFTIADKVVSVPTDLKAGDKVFVSYEYETANAVKVTNSTVNFPTAVKLLVHVIFRDVCTDKQLAGVIIIPKAKSNMESIDISLGSDASHGFDFSMMKDYCSTEQELFSIVVTD